MPWALQRIGDIDIQSWWLWGNEVVVIFRVKFPLLLLNKPIFFKVYVTE